MDWETGITPRRFLLMSNSGLSSLITGSIGESWPSNLDELRKLEPFSDDAAFREKLRGIRLKNKEKLAGLIKKKTTIAVDPASLFDIQVKRIHEYKRQQLLKRAKPNSRPSSGPFYY